MRVCVLAKKKKFHNLTFLHRWIGEDIGGSIECYDPMKNSWRMVGDLPEPRFSMGVVSFEGIYWNSINKQ